MHRTLLLAATLLFGTLLSSEARADHDDAPYKRKELPGVLAQIAARIHVVQSWRGVSEDERQSYAALEARIVAFEATVERTPHLPITATAIHLMDQVSAVMFNPQPDPPGVQASLAVLDRLLAVAFNPQPDPRGDVTKALGILDRIAAVAFNPQPDPPGRSAGIQVFDRISAIAFNPQPDPPGVIGRALDLLDQASEFMFNPQPDPPGFGTINQLVGAIDSMRGLAATR